MKFKILFAFVMLSILSCSTDSIDNSPTQNNAVTKLTLVNSTSKVSTPFFEPRETIVYMNDAYAIDKNSTYQYNFQLNLWQEIVKINNQQGLEIASNPNENSNFSFIKDSKWYVFSKTSLSSYNFETRSWNIEKQFDESEDFNNPIGVYSNDKLYVFSGDNNVVYTYNFEEQTFAMHSDLDLGSNYGQLVNSTFYVNGGYYYARLSDYRTITIYKLNGDFTEAQDAGQYITNSLDKGTGFVYKKSIVFGLGGNFTDNTDITLNDSFDYYDTNTAEFNTVSKEMYEARYVGLPISFGNSHYLLGGTTIKNGVETPRNTLDQLEFDFVEE